LSSGLYLLRSSGLKSSRVQKLIIVK
jgi:hypothetical protein